MTFPHQFETERLVLRKPKASDVPLVHEAVCESWKEFKPWFPWAQGEEQKYSGTESFVLGRIEAWEKFPVNDEDYVFYMFKKTDQKLLGPVGFQIFEVGGKKIAELGYWLRTRETGNGYTPEACRGLADVLIKHTEVDSVTIVCNALNKPSARTAEKAGFEFIREDYNLSLRSPHPGVRDRWYEIRR